MQYVVALIQHCKYLSNNYLTIFTEPEENTCFSIIIILKQVFSSGSVNIVK